VEAREKNAYMRKFEAASKEIAKLRDLLQEKN
jgi:hypothetical protein